MLRSKQLICTKCIVGWTASWGHWTRTHKHSLARGFRGHAPPGKFLKFEPLRWLEMHWKFFKCHSGLISTTTKTVMMAVKPRNFRDMTAPKGCQLFKDGPPQATNFRKVTPQQNCRPPLTGNKRPAPKHEYTSNARKTALWYNLRVLDGTNVPLKPPKGLIQGTGICKWLEE